MRHGWHYAVSDNATFLPCPGEKVFLCPESV